MLSTPQQSSSPSGVGLASSYSMHVLHDAAQASILPAWCVPLKWLLRDVPSRVHAIMLQLAYGQTLQAGYTGGMGPLRHGIDNIIKQLVRQIANRLVRSRSCTHADHRLFVGPSSAYTVCHSPFAMSRMSRGDAALVKQASSLRVCNEVA